MNNKPLNILFTNIAWEDYLYWQMNDRKTLKRLNALIKDTQRHPFTGIGKPEPLKYQDKNAWSRRVDKVNCLVYQVMPNSLTIIQCRFHY